MCIAGYMLLHPTQPFVKKSQTLPKDLLRISGHDAPKSQG